MQLKESWDIPITTRKTIVQETWPTLLFWAKFRRQAKSSERAERLQKPSFTRISNSFKLHKERLKVKSCCDSIKELHSHVRQAPSSLTMEIKNGSPHLYREIEEPWYGVHCTVNKKMAQEEVCEMIKNRKSQPWRDTIPNIWCTIRHDTTMRLRD